MTAEPTGCARQNASASINATELAARCGMTAADIDELVDYNALIPLEGSGAERSFSMHWLVPLRSVSRLRLDFDLDIFTVAMVLGHLDRIATLERKVQSLQALLPSHLGGMCHE